MLKGDMEIAYDEKFIAFVDILGFKNQIKDKNAATVARMITHLGSDCDMALYQEDGPEICPKSEKLSDDIGFRISQVSDCVIVSAEVSPSGLINIVNYCRKITERLLIRERVLCKGYLTKGQIYHEGMMFFGSGYQEALDGEKYAAGVEWDDGILGMPFIEIASSSVMPYLKAIQDECIKKQFEGMTFSRDHYIVISPYGVFDRLINWAIKPNCKTVDTMHKEIASARDLIDKLESNFQSAKVSDNRAKEKVRVNLEQLLQVREKLAQADNMIQVLSSPFP